MKTIHQLLMGGTQKLKENKVETPRLDAEIILAHQLGWSRLDLITRSERKLDQREEVLYNERIDLRAQGMPVQYIIGHQEFMGLNFKITPEVLIPRPDTEILVETAIQEAASMKKPFTIVEVGTGSGAISLSLAYFIENVHIHSTDISLKALEVARKNAQELSLDHKVKFYHGDLLSPIENLLEGKVDLLVSNPPYIPRGDISTLQREVQDYEPVLALDGGIDGLDFYHRIVEQGVDLLSPQGRMIFEVGYDQGTKVSKILNAHKRFGEIFIIKDLAGLERVVLAR